MLHRVLRGNHHERLRERPGVPVDGHLIFIHGFEQRRLRLGSGAVNLVGQQEVGENRSRFKFETFAMRVVNGDA